RLSAALSTEFPAGEPLACHHGYVRAMNIRRALSALTIALVALTLTACQSATSQPPPEPSPSAASANPTPTPTVTYDYLMREQLPSLARTDTIQGGVALAAAFIEQHPLLFMEG